MVLFRPCMITISDALLPEHVVLALPPTTPEAAIDRMAAVLKTHPNVEDWETFRSVLKAHPACLISRDEFGLCIPHARTEGVTEIVMSAGRFTTPLVFPNCEKPVRYVFCIGVPQAMAADYLRITGALMRVLSDPATEEALRAATTRVEFVEALSGLETRL